MDEYAIARERIARERQEQTGFLALGRLGLSELPEELFELTHLRGLHLGKSFYDEDRRWHSVQSDGDSNVIGKSILTFVPKNDCLAVRPMGGNP